MNEPRSASTVMRIEADHPALAGHFPGRPVIPGVVLLDRIAALAELAGLGQLRRIAMLKFLSPALPEQVLELQIEREGIRARFAVKRDGQTILRGEGEMT